MKGSVDQVTAEGSVGWLFAEASGRKPVVQAYLRHRLMGQAVADLYRPDLEQVGLGDGRHGFEIRFDETIDPGYLPFISIRPEGYDLAIPSHGNKGLIDLVRRIAGEYPTASRHRSVLGGLWTDRLDAPALLAGRLATGSVHGQARRPLSDLISRGVAKLAGGTHEAGNRPRPGPHEIDLITQVAQFPRQADMEEALRPALSSLADFFFNETLVHVLRGAFDDHPVAYRIDVLASPQSGFAQACAVEILPSPGECALLYMCAGAGARVDIVRDSHELAEFSDSGQSRWTAQGNAAIRELVEAKGASIEAMELDWPDMLLVGPGTVHRVVAQPGCPVLRVLLAPRRVTPTRFLSGEGSWLEVTHASGARLRL